MKKSLIRTLLTIPLIAYGAKKINAQDYAKVKEPTGIERYVEKVDNEDFKRNAIRECRKDLWNVRYVSDMVIYKKELIQHPDSTIKLQRGDCDDFVAYAQNFLEQKGIESKIEFGKLNKNIKKNHVWLVLELNGVPYVFDPINKGRLIKRPNPSKGTYMPTRTEASNFFKNKMVPDYEKRTGYKLKLNY